MSARIIRAAIPELTPTIVNEFIQKIIVHAPDNPHGHRRQQVDIIFNFAGQMDIPMLSAPATIEKSPTRKETA